MNEETSLEKDGVNITHLYFVACTETQKYIKSIQALNFFTSKRYNGAAVMKTALQLIY